jgi:hypothetical protein
MDYNQRPRSFPPMPPPLDLFAAAAANAEPLEASFVAVRAAVPADRAAGLLDFSAFVQGHGRISINIRLSALNDFLAVEVHQNVYEWAAWMAARSSTRSADAFLRAKLSSHYPARMAFDGAIANGRQLRYGTLNAGSVGPGRYGEFCIVLRQSFPTDPAQAAYLPGDSLDTYLGPDLVVDLERLARDAAPHSHRHLLATLKHAEELPRHGSDRWAAMLSSDETYVEAVFAPKPTPADVGTLRMKQSDRDRYFDFLFEALAFGKADDWLLLLAQGFRTTLRLLERKRIYLEVIDDAQAAGIRT